MTVYSLVRMEKGSDDVTWIATFAHEELARVVSRSLSEKFSQDLVIIPQEEENVQKN